MPTTPTNTKLTMLAEEAVALLPRNTEIGRVASWVLESLNANEQPLLSGQLADIYGYLKVYDLRGYLELPRELEHLSVRLHVTYDRHTGALVLNNSSHQARLYAVGRRWQVLAAKHFNRGVTNKPDQMYSTLRSRSRALKQYVQLPKRSEM